MSGAASFGFGPRSALYWGVIWGVGVGLIEYLAVAPIDDWGSLQQLLFWLVLWLMPFWCAFGIVLVALADHRERLANRTRFAAVFIALSVLAAALQPLLSIGLIDLTISVFPGLERYLAKAPNRPQFSNWGTLGLYQLWGTLFYGTLLVAARVFTGRVERTRQLRHRSAMAQSRIQALLDAARLEALQSQIDPTLLLESMQELEQRYRASPDRAERLLEALVEFLRYAMHGLRVAVSTVDAEVQLARAFAQLQQERGIASAWRIAEEPWQPNPRLKFPSLLMLQLLALGEGGRPLLRVRSEGAQTILSLHGLSRSLSDELRQQIRIRLHALYRNEFTVECVSSAAHQITILLQPPTMPPGEVSHA